MEEGQKIEDGYYRVVYPNPTHISAVLKVEDDIVDDDAHIDVYLKAGIVFTRVYPIHLPDEMMEWIHNMALAAVVSDDDVVEEAVRRFILAVKKEEN